MFLKNLITAAIINCLLFSLSYAQVNNIDADNLKQMMAQDTVLIDIRRAEEWQQTGIVKGSHLLTFFDKKGNYDIEKWLNEFNKIVKKDQPFVLICRTGNRTDMVSNFMDRKLGYKNVNHLAKGITNWIRLGNMVEKP